MPFNTIERSNKRLKPSSEIEEWYMQPPAFDIFDIDWNNNNNNNKSLFPSTPIDIPYTPSVEDHISPWYDDNTSSINSPLLHRPSTCSTLNSPPKLLIDTLNEHCNTTNQLSDNPLFKDILSKIRVSYSDVGINLEAKINNASDLRSMIDAFSQMCCSSTSTTPSTSPDDKKANQVEKMPVYRNKSNQTKPVNFFETACNLGQIPNPHSCLDASERQIADSCIDTFFSCWVRYKPILKKDEFMQWYLMQENPLDTLIVNAICSFVFRHHVMHHPQPLLDHFLKDQDKLQEQEEYFFTRARECLAQTFDTPDRYTVAALLFMSVRAEHAKRHHYAGMAASALQELEIYPRMANEDADDYDKEMDTRLWWFVWAIDFSLYTAGAPKNTPQPRYPGEVDLPQVFEQDIDECETSVIAYTYCLQLWKIQSDIVATLYEQDNFEMTVEQLVEYDRRLLTFHEKLPKYLVLGSGFEYGCDDLFVACLRVNIEYNATRIILHKLFIPEINDSRPSQVALESLNICLQTALTQLSTIKTCNMADFGRCAFDRDELWRAAEVISIATDVYHNCASPLDQAKILKGIPINDFTGGLTKAYNVLQDTREFRFECKNWFQVSDWIQVEIRRHQLVHSSAVVTSREEEEVKETKPDYFLAHLKSNAILNTLSQQAKKPKSPSKPKLTRKPIAFQNQFSIQQNSFQTDRKASFSAAPPFVQFNAYTPPDQQSPPGKSPARFRYFNPRKMNKFLFIDEHPMI